MSEKIRYTDAELQEFRLIILKKLEEAQIELEATTERLRLTNESMATSKVKGSEESLEVEEQEQLNYLVLHQKKFISYLRAALIRIANGTYGVCATTGKLIDKERLRVVPHTTHSVEAKKSMRKPVVEPMAEPVTDY